MKTPFLFVAIVVFAISSLSSVSAQLVDGECSCAPLEYNFILNLDSNCETDDFEDNDGIGLTFCFLGSTSTGRRLGSGSRTLSSGIEIQQTIELVDEDMSNELTPEMLVPLAEEIEIISIQFLEFDTSGELIVINQDDSYSSVTLQNGSEVTFKSISNDLDSSLSIEDQLDFLPGGVQVTLRGRVTDDVTGDSRIVSNRITWSYTNACDVEPLDSDESIGWITTGELTPASPDFCPAVIPPPETTEAPPTTTEEPSCDLGTIVDVAVGNGSFGTLVAALTAAGLVDVLSSEGLTVFAPTNEAFAALPEGTVDSLLLPENIDQLTRILTYHVVAGKVESGDLSTGPVTTVNGADVDISVDDDGGVRVNDSTVIVADVQACNGVIHGIDQVLLPPQSPPATEAPPSEPTTVAPPLTTEATPLPPATTDGPTFSKSSKSKSEKATTKSSKVEKMSLPSAKSKKGDTKSSKLMAAVSHLAAISDEMEMTLNESSSVIEALVTLTSNEDSNKSSTEAVDDEDI